jgi:hypothetical protein
MLARLLALVVLLLMPAIAASGDDRRPPPKCAPRYVEDLPGWRQLGKTLWDDWVASTRASEARRIGNDPRVLRHLDRLYLAREDGGVITLADCTFFHFFVYDHFDDTGGFYFVAKYQDKDFYYVAVPRTTGAELVVFTKPDWSPDRKRFAHGGCGPMMGPPDELYVVRQTEQGPQAEASVPLPCPTAGQCSFSWESASAISVLCPNDALNDRVRFRFVLQGDTWIKITD